MEIFANANDTREARIPQETRNNIVLALPRTVTDFLFHYDRNQVCERMLERFPALSLGFYGLSP